MIVSAIGGRVRLRHLALRSESTATAAREQINALAGVHSVDNDCRVGSLLVRFDPSLLDAATIAQTLQLDQPRQHSEHRRGRGTAPSVLLTMGGSLALLLGSLAFKAKHIHMLSGLAFVVSTGLHMVRHGRRSGPPRRRSGEENR